LYGWEQRDEPYKELFEEIKSHPNMTYHGTVSQPELRKAIGKAHIFSYPSIWQETSCLCAIEAMSGGCYTVTSSLAALPETCANFGILYPYTENVNDHANRFFSTLEATVRMAKTYGYQGTLVQKPYFDLHYSWQNRKSEWEHLLQTLLKE
jgi:glycosyltransferase involved in cell wall biosynthesis